MSEDSYENKDSSHNTLTNAYEFAKQIKGNIESIDLEDAYTAVKVDFKSENGDTDITYSINATDIYREMDHMPETTYFESSSTIESVDGIPPANEEAITEALEETLDSALMINGKIVRELISPDYDAF